MLTFDEAKKNFFDRTVVTDAVDEGSRRELSKLGAYTRTVAKRSIKKARKMKPSEMSPEMAERFKGRPAKQRPLKASDADQPPRSRSGKLKAGILYAFDPATRSAVAGATKFSGGSKAPETLEFGGEGEVEAVQKPPRRARKVYARQLMAFEALKESGRLKAKKLKKKKIKVAVKKRPFMRPAMDVVAPMMPAKFKNLISD